MIELRKRWGLVVVAYHLDNPVIHAPKLGCLNLMSKEFLPYDIAQVDQNTFQPSLLSNNPIKDTSVVYMCL